MGCSASKAGGGVRGRGHQSPPIAPEPTDVDDNKPEAWLSAATSTKTDFHTHTTESSSFYGFKGGGRSLASLGSTAESNPRSEGGSELGSVSLFSTSSKRSGGFGGFGGFGGEKLSEHSDEEGFEEDFEDDDKQPTPSSASAAAATAPLGAKRPGLAPLKAEVSPSRRRSADVDAPAPAARYAFLLLIMLCPSSFFPHVGWETWSWSVGEPFACIFF